MPKILVHWCFIQQLSLRNRMNLVIIFVSNSNKINECGVLVLSSYLYCNFWATNFYIRASENFNPHALWASENFSLPARRTCEMKWLCLSLIRKMIYRLIFLFTFPMNDQHNTYMYLVIYVFFVQHIDQKHFINLKVQTGIHVPFQILFTFFVNHTSQY